MVTLHLSGRITENGKLDVELPQGLPSGDVEVIIQIPVARDQSYTLSQLLAEITEENLHGEVDSGFPVGNEAW